MGCRRGAKMERRFLSGTLMGQLVAEVVVVVVVRGGAVSRPSGVHVSSPLAFRLSSWERAFWW